MGRASTATMHVARISHRCSICAGAITPGQMYRRYRWYGDDADAPVTCKVHPDCARLMADHDVNEWDLEGDAFSELLCDLPADVAYQAAHGCEDRGVEAIWVEILDDYHETRSGDCDDA